MSPYLRGFPWPSHIKCHPPLTFLVLLFVPSPAVLFSFLPTSTRHVIFSCVYFWALLDDNKYHGAKLCLVHCVFRSMNRAYSDMYSINIGWMNKCKQRFAFIYHWLIHFLNLTVKAFTSSRNWFGKPWKILESLRYKVWN